MIDFSVTILFVNKRKTINVVIERFLVSRVRCDECYVRVTPVTISRWS